MIARLARVVKPRVAYNFSKDPKEGKGGKKEEPKAAAPVVEQVTNDQLLQKWFHNAHPSLSPSEATLFQEGFPDLTTEDKAILNDLAGKILLQPTAIFYDITFKKGALGTSELLFTSVDPPTDADLEKKVLGVRKQL